MKKRFPTPFLAAIPIALLTLAAGCATRSSLQPVYLLDGRHVKSWTKAEAAAVPALADQAAVSKSFVYVSSDEGLKLMYGLDVSRAKDQK